MQAVNRHSGETARPIHRQPKQKHHTQGCGKSEKNYGAFGCRNAFLSERLPPIAQQCIIRESQGAEYNYITQENYEFLRDSYFRYAELLGVKAEHRPQESIGASINALYHEMTALVGDDLYVNFEYRGKRLYFALWKHHRWGNNMLYWFPMKFLECLDPELRRIAVTFLHDLMRSNGLDTMIAEEDTEYVLDWRVEYANQQDEKQRKDSIRLLESYQEGKAFRLLKRVRNKSYYKDLPAKLAGYEPRNDFEQSLIRLMREGLEFIVPERSIMQYAYDPYFDEEPDYYPVSLDRQIRFIYDADDDITSSLVEFFNDSLQESYEIVPATVYKLSPDTEHLFSMDDYPERFFEWADKFIALTI